jgi:hypothetical protein
MNTLVSRATGTNDPKPGSFNLPHSSGGQKSKNKVLARLVTSGRLRRRATPCLFLNYWQLLTIFDL